MHLLANINISLSHIVIFFLLSGVMAWTIILIAGIHAALTWIEPLFVNVRKAPRIIRYRA